MKNNAFLIIVGLIIGLVAGWFFFREPPVADSNTTPTTIDQDLPPVANVLPPEIIYRDTTIYKDSIVYVIKWKDRIIEVPIPVDTAAIVADYLLIKNYILDTTANDVVVHEETAIFANRMLNRSLTIQNIRECKETSVNGLSVGAMAGYHEFSVLAGYTYNKNTYLAGYNIYENQFKLGVLFKLKPIKLRKIL